MGRNPCVSTVKGGMTKRRAASVPAQWDERRISQKVAASARVLFIFQLVPMKGRVAMERLLEDCRRRRS